MNDCAIGAVEALHWALCVLRESRKVRGAIRELEAARDDPIAGISIDFRERLRVAAPRELGNT